MCHMKFEIGSFFFGAEEKLNVGKLLLKHEKGIKWAAESAERSRQTIHDSDMALSYAEGEYSNSRAKELDIGCKRCGNPLQ